MAGTLVHLSPRSARHRKDPDAGANVSTALDVRALEAALRAEVDGEVRFDAGTRALYATDASNFRQPPIGVVIPRSIDAVVATHEVCRRFDAPILPRGCGTSLSGETVNYAVVVDFSKYLDRILEIDAERRLVHVEPGAINEKVNVATGAFGLVFGPDPSTHAYCTIGGNVGNNSCGVHSIQARFAGNGSRTSDNVHELDVLTYDGLRMTVGATSEDEVERIVRAGGRRGEIYGRLRDLRDRYADEIRARFPDIPRRVSGYNLDELLPENGFNVARALVGTEGTCVTVLHATLLLVPDPPVRCLLVAGYDDIFEVGRHLTQILAHRPIGCEALDHELFRDQQQLHMHPAALSQLPDGRAWVLIDVAGEDEDDARRRAEAIRADLARHDDPPTGLGIITDPVQRARLWEVREAGLGATAFPPDGGDQWPGWEDSAVAPEQVASYLRDLRSLYDRYGLRGAMYGHLGDGCIHSRISFDLRTPTGVSTYRRFLEDAARLVASYGGSLSGEHGDGQQRAELLPIMFGDEIVQAFREFKAIWDPRGRMNPGKVVDPLPLDANLKLGVDYNPPRPNVTFAYAEDAGDFAHATVRCVGVGKCRQPDGVDVMCPSFIATREEKHTTRGRARLLFEMLEGDVVTDGWRSTEVKEALDLCLSCKGCTNDCPVHVDMPTYKAEFLHHHWKRRVRPRQAYALGWIDKWAAIGSRFPRIANAATRAPVLSRVLLACAGVSRERAVPQFASEPLQAWFEDRAPVNVSGPPVVLWPDTFTNRFHAEVGRAAVDALEGAGYRVLMPRGHVCCGRPLYDYGMLDTARRYLNRMVDVLRPFVRDGVQVVGVEPSCVAVMKDELLGLLPHDDDARRLAMQARHFAEFFEEHELAVPSLGGSAVVWGHCHHKATGGIDPELALLRRMDLDVENVVGGCCGLAGSWGFEADHHALSMQIGEHAVFPAVRGAAADAVVVADGFSCRTQIEAGTGRRAVHVAELVARSRVP
jgi:FAD/FMN-containing dehydrogenase/Fe-S oxidoreductase